MIRDKQIKNKATKCITEIYICFINILVQCKLLKRNCLIFTIYKFKKQPGLIVLHEKWNIRIYLKININNLNSFY